MKSSTDICNFALSCLGSAPLIQNLDTDTSKEARVCRTFFYDLKDQALHSFNWNWAKAFVQLQIIGFYPSPEWAFAYAVPKNVMRLSRIWNGKHTDDWETTQEWDQAIINGQNALLSNFGPQGLLPTSGPYVPTTNTSVYPATIDPSEIPVLTYVASQDDALLFPETFKVALAMAVAAFSGPSIPGIGQTDLFDKWIARANAKLLEAAAEDMNQSRVKPEKRSLIEQAGRGIYGNGMPSFNQNYVDANYQI